MVEILVLEETLVLQMQELLVMAAVVVEVVLEVLHLSQDQEVLLEEILEIPDLQRLGTPGPNLLQVEMVEMVELVLVMVEQDPHILNLDLDLLMDPVAVVEEVVEEDLLVMQVLLELQTLATQVLLELQIREVQEVQQMQVIHQEP